MPVRMNDDPRDQTRKIVMMTEEVKGVGGEGGLFRFAPRGEV